MALEGIQGIYPRCLSIPHEGGSVYLLKPWVTLTLILLAGTNFSVFSDS